VENLLEMPGVGPYTAGVTLAVASRQPVPFVDAGISRLLRRYFGLPQVGAQDRRVWSLAKLIVGTRNPRLLAWGLLDLSRTVCRVKPRCDICPLRPECSFGAHAAPDPTGANDGLAGSPRRSR
jgi:A/G-specific adenine glycosylase